MTLASLGLAVLLPLPLESWVYGHVPPAPGFLWLLLCFEAVSRVTQAGLEVPRQG